MYPANTDLHICKIDPKMTTIFLRAILKNVLPKRFAKQTIAQIVVLLS